MAAPRGPALTLLPAAPRRLILGLGNPGVRYLASRHNRGREVVEEIARRRGWRFSEERCASRIASGDDLILAVPETFMNRSGLAARCFLETERLGPENLLVVYDDIALPLGALRIRAQGGPGGQKGMASVIENIQTDEIARLRLGISPLLVDRPSGDLSDFVLSEFEDDERECADEQLLRGADACELWLENGVSAAMNQFNTPAPSPISCDGAS